MTTAPDNRDLDEDWTVPDEDGDATPPIVGEEAGRAIRRALAEGYVDPVNHDD